MELHRLDQPPTNRQPVAIKDELQSVLTGPRQKATFLAATAPHSSDWLMLYPSLPVGCVWTTRQFVLLWLCASD